MGCYADTHILGGLDLSEILEGCVIIGEYLTAKKDQKESWVDWLCLEITEQ